VNALVPNRFLFDFEFPLRYRAVAPQIDGRCADWTDAELLPRLGALDGQPEFGHVWACWNESGLFVACRVEGKRKPPRCDPRSFWTSDHLRLCTDMRDARTNRRGTRFCQQFYFLAGGCGPKKDQPGAASTPIRQAKENAPAISTGRIEVASHLSRTGYSLDAHVPADCLNGFDPAEHPRIGLYYMLEDSEHGQQYLTIGDDLLWYVDPSTWATAVLRKTSKPGR